jgi:protein FAM32A
MGKTSQTKELPVSVIGGKLKFKSDKNSKKIKRSSANNDANFKKNEKNHIASSSNNATEDVLQNVDYLTEAQKKHIEKKKKSEIADLKKTIRISFREKIENFNNKLATLTEHNDIPRVSADGNG